MSNYTNYTDPTNSTNSTGPYDGPDYGSRGGRGDRDGPGGRGGKDGPQGRGGKGGPPKGKGGADERNKRMKKDVKMIITLSTILWHITFAKMGYVGTMSLQRAARAKSATQQDGLTTSAYTGSVFTATNVQGLMLAPIGIMGWILTMVAPFAGASMFPIINSLIMTSGPAGILLFFLNIYKTMNRSNCATTADFQCWTSNPGTVDSWNNGSYTQQSRESYFLSIQMMVLSFGTTKVRKWIAQTIRMSKQNKQKGGKGGKGGQQGGKGGQQGGRGGQKGGKGGQKGGKGGRGGRDDKYDGYNDGDDYQDEDEDYDQDQDYDVDTYEEEDYGLEYDDDEDYYYDIDNEYDLSNSTNYTNGTLDNSTYHEGEFSLENLL